MSRLRAILSAGVCSVALSGCIPAVAGLALSAASALTGGGGNSGNGFHNPIDQQTTGRQVRQALSQLNDKVDPACQAMLDEHMRTYGTLAVRTKAKPGAKKAAEQAAAPAAPDATPPVNLLAKMSAPEAPAADVAVSADAAPASPAAASKPESAAPEPAVAALPADAPSGGAPAGPQPVKASLETDAAPGPGQCEHRWACLPGTPQPTIMMMCPGKGGKKPEAAATVTADAPAAAEGTSVDGKTAKGEQETAALGGDKSDATAAPAAPEAPAGEADKKVPGAPAGKAPAAAAEATTASEAEPAQQTIRRGGVADWNWSYDPSKRL
jgi:hypothetical protein